MAKTVVGLFDDLNHAQMAVRELQDNGFRREDISLVTHDPSRRDVQHPGHEGDDITEGAVGGAGVGAALGGIAGLVVGLGALTIPGIGPIVAAGPLASALAGAGIGAVTGGVVGALVDLGVPDQDANMYAEGIRRGGTLVTVRTSDDMADRAAQIIDHHGPVDIRREAKDWQTSGWQRFDADAGPWREETQSRQHEGEMTIPVVEEEMRVGKREVERGGVRVETSMEEKPVEETLHLREERVNVERRPVDRPASEADWDQALQDRSIEVREHGEEPVVQKQARVVEEVSVRKDVEERPETIRDTVRRTQVHTDDLTSDFDMYESDLQRHYARNLRNSGYSYDEYRPAYMYGYRLRRESTCNGDCRWEEIEAQARRDWEREHPQNAWEDFKDAVREGWNSLAGH